MSIEFSDFIVSPQARLLSEEILDMLVAYTKAYSEISLSLNESKLNKMKAAHREVKKQFPQDQLNQYTGSDLSHLPEAHKEQVKELLRLRNTLHRDGNFSALIREFDTERPLAIR